MSWNGRTKRRNSSVTISYKNPVTLCQELKHCLLIFLCIYDNLDKQREKIPDNRLMSINGIVFAI